MSLSRRQVANAVRVLSMDAVQAAKSGHPGMPMGMADIAEVLWNSYLVHNPQNPQWPNRDRFVVSNGHGSMLLYALLHLSGYDLPMEEIRRFRQLHSKTPGHPEYRCTPGVETTTGPLGQGFANAVGMAMAERMLAARFNRAGHTLIDHHTYVFAGDGCLMEGISHEAASLAGTLGLGKLLVLYDDNGISIDGDTGGWFTDDTTQRFRAYGWHVVPSVDGHDPDAIANAIDEARVTNDRPSLLCCKTTIGYGAPNKQGTAASHGAPLGEDETERARDFMGWQHPPFVIPTAWYEAWDGRERGRIAEQQWSEQLHAYREAFPDLAAEFVRCITGALPHDWKQQVALLTKNINQQAPSVATRRASQLALEGVAPLLPELVGGSADLTGSNLTQHATSKPFTKDHPDGNYVYYGVREFAMAAIMNGMALHGGIRPYGGTFLMFSEYARNALRMAALMDLPSIFVLTHDSIGLGEDGPTHQAVEQTATLRLLPNMSVWRPCDAVETTIAWQLAVERSGPTCLVLSRQSVPHQTRSNAQIANIRRGAYVLHEPIGTLHGIILATGSEVSLALDTARYLQTKGLHLRVISMPCCDLFDKQDADYKESLLPDGVRQRFAIEAGIGDGWHKYVGLDGMVIGIDTFGESAPAADVFAHFGFSVAQISARIEASLQTRTTDMAGAVG